jgi:ADP-L-glycero-D-manno-heptose 6-epimerase
MEQNYDFSVKLYNDCRYYGINFQWASSASVYGLVSTFNERAPVDPRNPYAWTKYLFERYVAQNPSSQAVSQGFRYFNVYGPEGEEHKGDQASPFYKFKKQAEETGKVKVFENSNKYQRDFVHVSQVVSTHLQFFDVKESGIWNVGTGKTMSFLDVAKKYSDNIVEIPMPDVLQSNYQAYTKADTAKLQKTLAKVTH